MAMLRKALGASAEVLDDARQVRVVCSSAVVDRVGDVVDQAGIDVTAFRRLKTVLWNHDQDRPVAKLVWIDTIEDHLEALIEFPPAGLSGFADEIYGLIKAGVINAVSIGFGVIEAEPRDGRNPRKGVLVTRSQLFEVSFVSVPANPEAEIVERALPVAAETAPRLRLKSLYDIGCLIAVLQSLGFLAADAAWETGMEQDGSMVPERLAAACRDLGAILLDMTAEEVAEFLDLVAPQDDAGLKASPPAVIKRALEDLRRIEAEPVAVMAKAGAVFSAANKSTLAGACTSILAGHDMIKALLSADTATSSNEVESEIRSTPPLPKHDLAARLKLLLVTRS